MSFFIRTVKRRRVVYDKYLVEAPDAKSASNKIITSEMTTMPADETRDSVEPVGYVDGEWDAQTTADVLETQLSEAFATRDEALASDDAEVGRES